MGDRFATMVVKEISYETTDPAIDSQLVFLQSAAADLLVSAVTPPFAVKTIRKLTDLKWKPLHITTHVSVLVDDVLIPAGLENCIGLISALFVKENRDPQWASDSGMNEWRTFMKTYLPDADFSDPNYIWAYGITLTLVQLMRQRDNISPGKIL